MLKRAFCEIAKYKLGDLSKGQGAHDKARGYYEKSLEIRKQLVSRTPDDLQALRDLSISYERMGSLCNAEGSRTEACEYYEKALEIWKKICAYSFSYSPKSNSPLVLFFHLQIFLMRISDILQDFRRKTSKALRRLFNKTSDN